MHKNVCTLYYVQLPVCEKCLVDAQRCMKMWLASI